MKGGLDRDEKKVTKSNSKESLEITISITSVGGGRGGGGRAVCREEKKRRQNKKKLWRRSILSNPSNKSK